MKLGARPPSGAVNDALVVDRAREMFASNQQCRAGSTRGASNDSRGGCAPQTTVRCSTFEIFGRPSFAIASHFCS
jgi:hypothetical protein